jgi:hypothetical protein
MGWTIEGSEFESRQEQAFSLLQVDQTGSGSHPTCYPMGIGELFPGGKAAELWSLPSTNAEVKEKWIYASTTPYDFMALCLIS